MKKMKRLAAFVLAMVMVLAMSMTAMAATITVPSENGDNDKNSATETYTAYKIFDVKTAKIDDKTGYSYTLDPKSSWLPVLQNQGQIWYKLELSADGTVYNVSLKNDVKNEEATAKAAAAWLIENKGTITGTTLSTGDNTVDDGYYLITSSLGSNLALATTNIPLTISEKNAYPSLTKAVDKNTASIGETVTFTLTLAVPASADKEVIVHDKIDEAFTIDENSIAAKDADTANVTFTKVTNKTDDDCTFELSFAADNAKGKTITITYSATLNAQAKINPATNKNATWLTYSNFKSTPSEVEVKTFSFDLVKTGIEKADNKGTYPVLIGAEFKLYDAETGGNEIKLVKDTDGTYRPALTGETGVVITADEATIKGLAGNATYYLEETKEPVGYNKLTARKEVKIETSNLTNTKAADSVYTRGSDTGVQVINETGTLLPSTGGTGTTIFYIVGGILVVGAGVLLIARKRMEGKKK